jgi:hypothetical protein
MVTGPKQPGGLVRIFGWSNAFGGVHHYRIREPLRGLALLGHETQSLPVAKAEVFEQSDVVLVRGLHNPKNSLLWRWAAAKKLPALQVYDLDDDIWSWRPGTKEYDYWTEDKRLEVELNIQCADLVTTPTGSLAELLSALNPNVAIVPNTVPERLLKLLPMVRERFAIGWQGAQGHIADLQLIYDPIIRFLWNHPEVEFHIWGPEKIQDFPEPIADRIIPHAWIQSVWGHYHRLSMDIGLAPLDPVDTFNITKSDIRLRELAALGIPFIASRSNAYTTTALSARGLVVETEDEWQEALTELYRNADLRAWMAEQGRLRARLWTTEGNAKELERIYERAKHRDTASPRVEPAGQSPGLYYTRNGDRSITNITTTKL